MALSPGTRLGVYEVTAKIGEGGMGEVYRARDTTLDRDVALKVLPEEFTSDPDRLVRFEREARVLASLNHTNIGHIYGLEEAEDTRALVLELVEGPTLADRIAQGAMPSDDALPIARQIAEALEAAHEQGVIHRDLKPANIKVRDDGTVKVLDFGLAKALEPGGSQPDVSQSPTLSLTAAATQMGTIIGTAAYMAPEQARGEAADRRADIWAFGVVLYEMLTGRRPFEGRTLSDTLASVLARDPDLDALPTGTPAAVRRLLTRCIEKDPKRRLRDVAEGMLQLEEGLSAESEPGAADALSPQMAPLRLWQRPASVLALAATMLLVGGLAVWGLLRPEPVPAGLVRFTIVPPTEAALDMLGLGQDLTLSPDGSLLVYKGVSDTGRPQLYVRRIDDLEPVPLRGSDGAVNPFMSPDGQWVGFTDPRAPGRLQRVSTLGGTPLVVVESPSSVWGATWGQDDTIVFGTDEGLFRVPVGGGQPEALTIPDGAQDETGHNWPSVIPDRNALVFSIRSGRSDPVANSQLAALDLGSGEVTRLGLAGVSPRYAFTGHLVYAAEDGSVRAVPFDAASLEVTGSPVPLIDGVRVKASGAADFSLSDDGRLVFVTGAGGVRRSLVWVDRQGQEEPIGAPPGAYLYPRLSPDGTRLLVDSRDDNDDIWLWDLTRGGLTGLALTAESNRFGIWTPDNQIVFSSARDGEGQNLYRMSADGTGPVERLSDGPSTHWPNSVARDGSALTFWQPGGDSSDINLLRLDDGPPRIEPLLATEFNELNGEISPDGAWLAYESDESGRSEIYVRPFPDVGSGRSPVVSTGGGQRPLWGPQGRELFYQTPAGIMGVTVDTTNGFTASAPTLIVAGSFFGPPGAFRARTYDIAPDGQRFVVMKDASPDGASNAESSSPEIHVVLNWFSELSERVPVP